MKRLAVLTGAGVSAESGFQTFRDSGGLWEQYDVNDVASHEGWYRNRKLVLDFYNGLRVQLRDAKPNRAHEIIAELEKRFKVDPWNCSMPGFPLLCYLPEFAQTYVH